jgi:phage tail tape-measure protein
MAFRLTARLLQQHGAIIKKSTGLTGLDVVPNAREVLVKLYEKTLKDIQASMAVRGVCAPRGRRAVVAGRGGSGGGGVWDGSALVRQPARAHASRARDSAPEAAHPPQQRPSSHRPSPRPAAPRCADHPCGGAL